MANNEFLSRRQFLWRMLAAVYVINGFKTMFEVRGLGVTALNVLANPAAMEILLKAAEEMGNGLSDLEANPNFTTGELVIKEAVQNYQNLERKQVRTVFSKERISQEEVFSQMNKGRLGTMTLSQLWLAMGDENLREQIKSDSVGAVIMAAKNGGVTRQVVESAAVDYQCFWDMVRAGGSGLTAEFQARAETDNLGIDFGKIQVGSEVERLAGKVVKERFGKVRTNLEAKKRTVKTAEVLQEFLYLNDGDLGFAIRDMSIFLKAMARNDPETGKFIGQNLDKIEEVVRSYTDLFTDEMSLRGKNWLEGKSLKARYSHLGLFYHLVEGWSLLPYASAEVIALMAVGNGLLSNGGRIKESSEFRQLERLQEIETELLRYAI